MLVPIRVQLVYRQHVLREVRANITSHVSDTHVTVSRTPLFGIFEAAFDKLIKKNNNLVVLSPRLHGGASG